MTMGGTSKRLQLFIWDDFVWRFGIPRASEQGNEQKDSYEYGLYEMESRLCRPAG